MIETIEEKHKLSKWYFFIPVIGSMIYSVRFEFGLNKYIIDGYKEFKVIKKYKSITNLISLAISLIFLILFFTLRNKHGYGSWPWFFWVGMGIGLSINVVPYPSWYLYKKGIEKFKNLQKNM